MQQYIGFNISSSEYMIPILRVREIISMPSVTVLPHLPDYIKGVTNLRGSIIPILHLKKLLNSGGDNSMGGTVIVLAAGKITFGIIVDGITGVIKADEAQIEPPESFISGSSDNIEGVAKINNKLIVLLDIKKLLPVDDLSLLEDAIIDVKDFGDGNRVEVTREMDTIGGKVTVKELHDAKQYLGSKIETHDPKHNIMDMMLDFMNALASKDYDKMENILGQLSNETDGDLFTEVGKITRKLHDSLEEFKGAIDHGLQKLTEDDVPNAVDKLQFVISKTEEAANKTMAIVERYFEESDDLTRHIENISSNQETAEYLRAFKESMDNDMTSIMTTQQFQDITGQTIKKVIELVNSVEAELLRLITQFGVQVRTATDQVETPAAPDKEIAVNRHGNHVEKVSQSDVEALLNDFGF